MITIPRYDPIYNIDLDFDGKKNNVAIATLGFQPLAKGITIEFWLKAVANNTGTVISYAQAGTKTLNIENVSNLNIWINGFQTTPTGVSVADDNWHFVAIRWLATGGLISLWVDGVSKWNGTVAPGTAFVPGARMVMGQSQSANGFDPALALKGEVFNFRIWNQYRTPFFMIQDMDRTLPPMGNTITWQLTKYATQGYVLGVKTVIPVTENLVYILNTAGIIQQTTDFGATFSNISSTNTPPAFAQMAAATDWIMGIDATDQVWVLKTGATPLTWTQPISTARFRQASIAQGGSGVGINASHLVYATSNYGVTYSPAVPGMQFVWVSTNGAISWAVGVDKKFYTSTTPGTSWTALGVVPEWVPVQVAVGLNVVVALSAAGDIYRSLDNGATWQPVLAAYAIQFVGVQLMGNTIWAIDAAHQLIFAELGTRPIITLMLDEGYGDWAFDNSGNNNHGLLGGGLTDGVPLWEVSTQLSPPGFIDDHSTLSYVASEPDPAGTTADVLVQTVAESIRKAPATSPKTKRK